MSGETITTAEVRALTAQVQVLKVGSRQVTLSVFRQLDRFPVSEIIPFGRVRDRDDDGLVVGRHKKDESLCAGFYTPTRLFRGFIDVVPDDDPCSRHFFSKESFQGCCLYHEHRWRGILHLQWKERTFRIHSWVPLESCPSHHRHRVPKGETCVPFVSSDGIRAMEAARVEYDKNLEDARKMESLPLIVLAGLK